MHNQAEFVSATGQPVFVSWMYKNKQFIYILPAPIVYNTAKFISNAFHFKGIRLCNGLARPFTSKKPLKAGCL